MEIKRQLRSAADKRARYWPRGPVRPYALSSFLARLARKCARHVHRRETTEAEEPATRFIMIASRRIYRLPDTPGKNGTAFTALHSLEACLQERIPFIRRVVPLFFDALTWLEF